MRGARTVRRWAMVPAMLAIAGGAAVLCAGPASAALAKGTLTAAPSCYFVNPDGSYSVNIDVTNNDPAVVTLKVGGENKFDPGADDQGQPESFAPGTTTNAVQATFKATDWSKAKWRLNGVDYSLTTSAVCPSTTVTAEGNLLAALAFSLLVTAGGGALMGNRSRRRSRRRPSHDAT